MRVTEKALQALQDLVRGNPDLRGLIVRFFLESTVGGCGPAAPRIRVGFDDESPRAEDQTWDQEGFRFVMTKRDALFLEGFELDYSENSEEKGFICRK